MSSFPIVISFFSFSYRNLKGKASARAWDEKMLVIIASNPALGKKDFKQEFTDIFDREIDESLASDEQ